MKKNVMFIEWLKFVFAHESPAHRMFCSDVKFSLKAVVSPVSEQYLFHSGHVLENLYMFKDWFKFTRYNALCVELEC